MNFPVESKQVINMVAWVDLEEIFFIYQAKSQALKSLEQYFHISLTGGFIFFLYILDSLAIENILSNPNLIMLHLFEIDPNSIFNKMHFQFIVLSKLNRKPRIRQRINLINEFKQWPFL